MTASRLWDEERMARASLGWVLDAGDDRLTALITEQGAAKVLQGLRARTDDTRWARRARAIAPEAVAEQAQQLGLRFMTPQDAEWPDQLTDLINCEPVQGMRGMPLGLWCKGPGQLAEWSRGSVAIVGARAMTEYGRRAATDLSYDLARCPAAGGAGRTVVSGGAYGIDTAAHQGAIAANGRTISVLAGGLDAYYPPRNHDLLEEIAMNQLLVSELPPGLRATRHGFLARNRLIAALSRGTVVVEAAARSGARNTASWAGMLSRQVMAVPGSINSARSVTPHRMIRDGEATLVCDAVDVGVLLSDVGEGPQIELRGPESLFDLLSPAQAAAREVLHARRATSTEEVIIRSGLNPRDCLVALMELENRGLVSTSGDATWRLVTPSRSS